MEQETLPEYKIFETARLISSEGEAVERAVISRAFRLKHLKYISRGKRKHQIDFANFCIFPPADSLEEGLFEWAVTIEAVETLRSYEFFRTQGLWTTFLAENPLTGRLRETARRIGVSVGLAARVWNDLGAEWPDLLDHFADRGTNTQVPRWGPFLAFYRLFQTSRRNLKKTPEMSLPQSIILAIGAESSDRTFGVLSPEAPLAQLLLACDIEDESIAELRQLQDQWLWLRTNRRDWLSGLADRGNLSSAVSAKIPEAVAKLIGESRLRPVIEMLHRVGVRFETATEMSALGNFEVLYRHEGHTLRVIPRISLESDVSRYELSPELILAHEVGHFLLNFGWNMELCLADFIINFFTRKKRGIDVVKLVNLKRAVYRRMVDFHSAIETAADEVAVEILLPEKEIKALYEECLIEDSFLWPEFFGIARSTLGIPEESVHWERFDLIIRDWAPAPTWPTRILITGKDLRRARFATSSRRVEDLLDRFWVDMRSTIQGVPPTPAAAIASSPS